MRKPSTAAQIYAWHNAALRGESPPIHDGLPEAGWYRTRLVKGGPWVPVEIRVEREIDIETGELTDDETMVAICEGRRRDAARLWTYLTPISRADFKALQDRVASTPSMAATMAPIDLAAIPMRIK